MKSRSKVLPQNIEAEQSVLGGILLDSEAINKVSELIGPDDFYLEAHKKIFHAILDVIEKNQPLDLITLTDYFLKKKQLEEVGGAAYLSKLLDNIATSANIAHHSHIVKEKSILRKLINVTGDLYNSGFDPVDDLDAFLDTAEEKVFQITQKERSSKPYTALSEVLKKSFKYIKKHFDQKEMVTGVSTGFRDLDDLTAGLQPSDLIIVAGRPGMGKTAFALSLMRNAAMEKGTPCAFFSLEMSELQIGMRLLCAEARVELSKARRGFLTQTEVLDITNAASRLSKAEIYIDDTAGMTILDLKSRARKLKAEKNIQMLMIDYLQLMRGRGNKDNREQEISEISRSLKALAKELDIPVVALSQLNRAVETKSEDKRPKMAHLRESGAIEQDADVIIMIYREDAYTKDESKIPDDQKNVAEIIIEKQRNGPQGTVKLYFNKKLTQFANLDKHHYTRSEPE